MGGRREREWGGVGLHSDISSVAVCHYKVYDFVADFRKWSYILTRLKLRRPLRFPIEYGVFSREHACLFSS